MAWQYQRQESEFKPIPEGRHRIRIKSAETAVSSKGNDMLALQFEVSGYSQTIYHYITFMDNNPEMTNRLLTQFFDSFKDIPEGDFNMTNWIGKVGGAQIKHEEYNGESRAKIHYFLRVKQQEELPPWKEPSGVSMDKDGYMQIDEDFSEDDVPFE